MHDFCFTLPYAFLLVLGGAIGFLRKASIPSLAGGVGSGALLFVAGIIQLNAFKARKNSWPAIILEFGTWLEIYSSFLREMTTACDWLTGLLRSRVTTLHPRDDLISCFGREGLFSEASHCRLLLTDECHDPRDSSASFLSLHTSDRLCQLLAPILTAILILFLTCVPLSEPHSVRGV